MRTTLSFAVFLLALAAVTSTGLSQVPEAPGTPLPVDRPEDLAAPELLPRTDALPEPPAPLYPNVSKVPNPGETIGIVPASARYISEQQRRQDEQRLERIRAVAMRNPQALALLRLARSALSVEARRNYIRAYYVTVCTRMRDMDPRLTRYIWDFERAQIRAIGRAKNPQVPNLTKK